MSRLVNVCFMSNVCLFLVILVVLCFRPHFNTMAPISYIQVCSLSDDLYIALYFFSSLN